MTGNQVPSDVVGARVKELRKSRGWSLADLSRECERKAGAKLSENTIENIEHGRRDKERNRRRMVTVDELLILADALDVAPIHLLVPIEEAEYPAVPSQTTSARRARAWIRGVWGLTGTDMRVYGSQVPEEEFGQLKQPEVTFYERVNEEGKVVEAITTREGNAEDLRLRRSAAWRRAEWRAE